MTLFSMLCRTGYLWLLAVLCFGDRSTVLGDEWDDFERTIRPILVEHCYECHSSNSATVYGGLRLDSAEGLARGGDSGPAIDPSNPRASLLLAAIRYEAGLEMPPAGKLSDRELQRMTAWVEAGAAFPPSRQPVGPLNESIDYASARAFWSFQPVQSQPLPAVEDPGWQRTRIDAFVLAAMHRQGLQPAPEADRRTLIRRLTFDLIGLPPTPAQVQQFLADGAPDAYERLVEALLASPAYGEHWARWWLDLARYADRTASWVEHPGQPYLYRDWVVSSLNADLPYDEFVRRQLATDLMASTGPEDLPALGFVSLSPNYWKELKLPAEMIKTIVADEWEERVDAVSRTFLGLTVACARCHDHKFDPISMEDYTALAGVFASCRQVELPTVSDEDYEPVRLAKLAVTFTEREIEDLQELKPPPRFRIEELKQTIERLERTTPGYHQPMATGLAEESLYVLRAGLSPEEGTRLEYRPRPRDLPVFVRGDPNRPGPVVPRRFLQVLDAETLAYEQGSGRLELADSLFTKAQSLVARVIVNRIWLGHFGRGLVTTPSNFGQQGARPSHPALLDDLAAGFIASDWDIKWLHRQIVLSATWRQASTRPGEDVDPENQWLARMPRRRLTFEQWRDAMLVASDRLDRAMGGPSLALEDGPSGNTRRTLYATVDRHDVPATMAMHDFPDPRQHSPQRMATATPLQGLYALNGPLLMEQAAAIGQITAGETNTRDRLKQIYWRLFSRAPSSRELQLGWSFVTQGQSSAEDLSLRWQQYLHALLASNELLFAD